MKNAKLLKSAVLSTALLFVGGAQAQNPSPAASLILEVIATSLTVSAAAISFGTHTVPTTAITAGLVCLSGGSATTTPTPISVGSCGAVNVTTTTGSTITYSIGVTATAMSSGGNSVTPALVVYDNAGTVVTGNQTVNSSFPDAYQVGGTLDIPANQAAGDYRGTYTFMATVVQ